MIVGAFTRDRCRAVDRPLWSYCRPGDDQDKVLDELEQGDQLSAETYSKIWDCLCMGYSKEAIKDALKLLANASWSSTGTEQTHASASVFMKHHREAGMNSLQTRSFVMQVALLVAKTAKAKRFARLQDTLARLETTTTISVRQASLLPSSTNSGKRLGAKWQGL